MILGALRGHGRVEDDLKSVTIDCSLVLFLFSDISHGYSTCKTKISVDYWDISM